MDTLVVDTSVIISVILGEAHRDKLLQLTEDKQLLAPMSLEWEMGNAFSAMFKKKTILLKEALKGIDMYHKIPIRLVPVHMKTALDLAHKLDIYAYDAYFLICCVDYHLPLLTLDTKLNAVARQQRIKVVEV